MTTSQPHDFAADVLDMLKRRKVTFRGCNPDYLEIFIDGRLKMWFAGNRNGKPWAGGLTLINPQIDQAVYYGDSGVIADLCEKIIDDNSARYY